MSRAQISFTGMPAAVSIPPAAVLALDAAGARDIDEAGATAHLVGRCPPGNHPTNSVTSPDGRTWDTSNLWICEGSLMPTPGGVNPSLPILANAARISDRMIELARRGEL